LGAMTANWTAAKTAGVPDCFAAAAAARNDGRPAASRFICGS
jgi:hypothetical protein